MPNEPPNASPPPAADRRPERAGRDWRGAARRALPPAARGAALAVLVWAGAAALGIPDLFGVAPHHVFALAGIAGGVFGALGAERALRAAAVGVALLLVLVTSLPIAAHVAPSLVRRDRPAADSGAVVDAVAVLSSGVGDDGLIQGEGVDRLLAGLALAQRTGRPLVLSVVRPRRRPGVSSLPDQQRLVALAGLGDRVWTVDSVKSTHDEAVRMAALARARGWRRVALVTSPAHARRACATFEHAGLAVVCSPAPARDAAWGGPTPLRSPGDRLRVVAAWVYETLGWLVYRRRGWV